MYLSFLDCLFPAKNSNKCRRIWPQGELKLILACAHDWSVKPSFQFWLTEKSTSTLHNSVQSEHFRSTVSWDLSYTTNWGLFVSVFVFSNPYFYGVSIIIRGSFQIRWTMAKMVGLRIWKFWQKYHLSHRAIFFLFFGVAQKTANMFCLKINSDIWPLSV